MRLIIFVAFTFLLSSCNDDSSRYNGYVDADLIYLSSDSAGRLSELSVERGEPVHANQFLFKVEQKDNDYAVKMSELTQKNLLEQRKELLNQLQYDERNYQRIVKMQRQDAASQNDLDMAKRDLSVLKNKLAALNFQIKSSILSTADKKWSSSRKEGYANQSGIVFDTYFTKGEYLQPGQPVLSLLTPEHIKVIFFVAEPKLNTILLHSKIKLFSGDKELGVGTINYISKVAQYTPPIIYSREDSHNLVFRVEARIDKPNLNQIHLGQPITLELAS